MVTNPYKSDEELYFSWYIRDLVLNGYVESFEYEPYEITLSDPIKVLYRKNLKGNATKEYSLMEGKKYTPDFLIRWKPKAYGLFFANTWKPDFRKKLPFYSMYNKENPKYDMLSIFEVKPVFDMNNMTREVSIIKKWVYQRYGVIINIVKVPNSLFKSTFTPKRFMSTTKTNKPRAIKFNIRTLQEFEKHFRQDPPKENNLF